jgi:hypothetical protein
MKARWARRVLAVPLVLGVGLLVADGLATAAAHVLDWRVSGSGDVAGTCADVPGFAAGCTLTSAGALNGVRGTHVGNSKYGLSLTTGTDPALNAGGGACLPANNPDLTPGTVNAANGNVIEFSTVGWLCEEGAPGSALHYNGTYRITGGTGRFVGAVGGGNLVATFERVEGGAEAGPGAQVAFIKLDGVINF